jgi:membrane protein DedA with SNARE-associated domain
MINAELGDAVIEFVRTHEIWTAPIVFGLVFLELFAFLLLLVPATVILFGISGLLGAASVEFWPIYTAGVLGAFVGDCFAFELASILKKALQGCGRYRSIPDFRTTGVF